MTNLSRCYLFYIYGHIRSLSLKEGLIYYNRRAKQFKSVSGVGGNLLVILTIRRPHMKTVTNVFITNLAVADFLVCLLNVPMVTTLGHLGYWPFGELMCKFLSSFQGVSLSASVGTLIAIAADRFKMVVLYQRPNTKLYHAYMYVALIWISSTALPFPLLLFSHIVPDSNGNDLCVEIWPDISSRKIYTLLVAIFLYFIPLGAISVLYWLIIRKLWSLTESQKVSQQRQKRIVRMLVVVVVLFAVCWLPYHIIFLYMDFGQPQMTYSILAAIMSTQWFIYSNSACNPIVYAVFNANYRREFSRMLRCKRHELRAGTNNQQETDRREMQRNISITDSREDNSVTSCMSTTAI
ncbi:hypothetical protein ACROYT_G006857 [Oculina patagonica]